MSSIKIFEEKKVRSQYDAEKEGNKTVTNCNQLKLQSEDGKFYKTDVGRACLLVLSAVPESGKTVFLLNLLLSITVKKKNLLLNRMTMGLFPLL